jgi:hypothetical protein
MLLDDDVSVIDPFFLQGAKAAKIQQSTSHHFSNYQLDNHFLTTIKLALGWYHCLCFRSEQASHKDQYNKLSASFCF